MSCVNEGKTAWGHFGPFSMVGGELLCATCAANWLPPGVDGTSEDVKSITIEEARRRQQVVWLAERLFIKYTERAMMGVEARSVAARALGHATEFYRRLDEGVHSDA